MNATAVEKMQRFNKLKAHNVDDIFHKSRIMKT